MVMMIITLVLTFSIYYSATNRSDEDEENEAANLSVELEQ
jgi:hypothetical protein